MEYRKNYYGFVYKWINRRNQKYYIGSHHGSTDDGYIGSGIWFKRAYKLEPENFTRVILEYIDVDDPLITLEREDYYLLYDCEVGNKDKCYNISRKSGGGWNLHGKTQEEISKVYKKISETLKNKTPEEKQIALEKAQQTISAQPEKYAAAIKKQKETKKQWSDERKASMIKKMKNTLANNPEIKEKALHKFKSTVSLRSDEKKKEIAEKRKRAITDEYRQNLSIKLSESRRQRTKNEIEDVNQKISASLKARDPELKKESYQRGAESFRNRSPKEKAKSEEIRKAKWLAKREQTIAKIRAAKRKDKPDAGD